MRLTSRPTALAVAALAAALTLTACGGGDDLDAAPSDGATTQEGAPEETATDEAAQESSQESSPTPTVLEVEVDVAAVDFGAPGSVTSPGAPLTRGEPAWLNQTVSYGDQEITGATAISVLDVRALDASLFEQYSNAADFAGYTPYAITFQQQWLYDIPAGHDPSTLDLFPVKEDGGDGEYLTSQFGFGASTNACGLQLPEYDEATKTLVSCIVGLTKDSPIVTAKYNGESYSSIIASSDNPYFTSPLTWS